MSTAPKRALICVADYLAGELRSPIKHEYLGGGVYAMAGAVVAHNIIAGNVYASLHGSLRGKPFRPFNSDMKIRVDMSTHTRFYYPDLSVICRSNPQDESFLKTKPVVLVEVLSRSTRRVDDGEKKDAYLTIPSLGVYVMLEQDIRRRIVFRRN